MSHAAVWIGTTLRVADGAKAARFYEEHFNLTLINRLTRPGSTSYYLVSFKDKPEKPLPVVGSPEADDFLTTNQSNLAFLELLQEDDAPANFVPCHGNEEPHRGFGHIAFNVEELRPFCTALEAEGVKFKKRPDEGSMKFIAFVFDLDGYWIEIVERGPSDHKDRINLSQTMIRVSDPASSVQFYEKLQMRKVYEMKFDSFSLSFMSSGRDAPIASTDDYTTDERKKMFIMSWEPVLELTYNFDVVPSALHAGNTDPKGMVGLTFMTADLAGTLAALKKSGIEVENTRKEGVSAFCRDSTGYLVNIVQQGAKWTGESITP